MKQHLLLLMAFVALSATACGQPSAQEHHNIKNLKSVEQEQLRKDIGEMLLVGFRGTKASGSHIVRDIKEYGIGGVILFEYDAPTGRHHRNVESPRQLKQLCSDLQGIRPERLLIGIDQEGGRVCRMKAKDGFPRMTSAEASALGGKDSVQRNAEVTARALQEAGINLNFAPCVDVNVNPSCPIIGKLERSFSKDPATVSDMASLWIAAQSRHGVVSCLKHFPGHGSASGDTHRGLVDVSESWQEDELEPYRTLIAKRQVAMVMVAHVVNRQLGDDRPASLSPVIVRERLRNEMGFDGVVVTDDLAMGAITRQYGYEDALRMAILAGNDLLCISNNGTSYDEDLVPKTIDLIAGMVAAGELSAADIHASAERIRRVKASLEE